MSGKMSGSRHLVADSVGDMNEKFSWLNKHAPQFFIKGDQVQVITEPTQFYEVLKVTVFNVYTLTCDTLNFGTQVILVVYTKCEGKQKLYGYLM